MAATAIFKIVRFRRNFVRGNRTACRQRPHKKLQIVKIQDGGRPPFWKSLNRHISVKNHPILMKLGTLLEHDDSHVTEILKIQDGSGRYLENRFFGHNSSIDRPISAKFRMRKENGMSIRATWQKLQIFKIQDGERPPFWKLLNRHISVTNRPILISLGTLHQILNPTTVTWQRTEIFEIQDGGGRHLQNRFFGHKSSTDCPIAAKFCMRKQNSMSIRATGQKCKFLKSKMADGRNF